MPIYSIEVTEFPSALENLAFFVGDLYIRGAYLVIFVVALIIMALLHRWLNHTKNGLAIRAVEENPEAAWLLGINGRRVEIMVFAAASAIAGAAGCLIGVAYGTVSPFFGSNLLLVSFVVLVLAGIGSVRGAMICGLLVGVIETVTAGTVSSETKEAVLFVVLFAVLLIRPQGIFAGAASTRDWRMAYLTALFEISGLNILLALSVFATLMVGQFSIAQVGFWSIGAFVSAMLTTMYGFPLFSALLISGIICAVIGIALGYPCLRIKGIYLTLATVAFAEVVRVVFGNLYHQVEIDGQMVGPAGALGFRGVDVIAA